MKLILNTLIYAAEHQAGVKQADMVGRIAALGADGIELRREYFTDVATELPEAAVSAKKLGLTVNYSVPDVLFLTDGTLNPKLATYYSEAKAVGIAKIKFNVGGFDAFSGDLAATLLPFAETIETNVENDQSQTSGRIEPILNFLQAAQAAQVDIQYVYDMGNWAFVSESAELAATKLAPYTRYIHLKNTQQNANALATPASLEVGMYDWRALIALLPPNVQYALEYPMPNDQVVADEMALVRGVVTP